MYTPLATEQRLNYNLYKHFQFNNLGIDSTQVFPQLVTCTRYAEQTQHQRLELRTLKVTTPTQTENKCLVLITY